MPSDYDKSGSEVIIDALAYTAAQLAACLGRTPQAVRKSLKNISPATVRIVSGNESSAWTFSQLPQSYQEQLTAEASKRRYRDAGAMLLAPPVLWEPPIPLDKIADSDIEQARKLRDALMPWLIQQHDQGMSSGELEAKGVADYARFFGRKISGRYWRELFMRTLRRDNGAENWIRLEIYLPTNPTPKQAPSRMVTEALAEQFTQLSTFIDACSNPAQPTETECRAIWTSAFEQFSSLVHSGTPAKQAARRLRDFLFAKASFLAPSRDALLKAFDRKFKRLQENNGDANAIRDGRADNGEQFGFPQDDRDLLVHRAVFQYRGDVAPAWRDLLQKGFSDVVRERYAGKAACKSYVPATVLESVRSEVEILTVMHQGKRAFDSIRGHIDRNYEGIHSLDAMVADDFTMPVYYYVPDGNGWFNLTRGQILIFQDFRTLRVLGWSMQPDRNYNSLVIRSLVTHVFSEFGVPSVLVFENGIWRTATLLKGRDPGPMEFTEVVQGLREFGIQFVHCIRPRSKTVERVGGLLQDLMEAEPGYCGRNERVDAPESLRKQMAEVTTRKVHPSRYFFSFDQWQTRFAEIVEQYNKAPQQGRILKGLSPEDALVQFANVDDPPKQFSSEVRYLLAHDKRILPVTLNGITFQVGKQKYNYRGKEIAHLVGKTVLSWFDPENPETITVTDLKRNNAICVNRTKDPSALECLTDPDSTTLGCELARVEDQASYMKARFSVLKSKIPLPQRKTLADAQTVNLGKQFESQKTRAQEQKDRSATLGTANRAKARAMGISSVLVGDDEETRMALELMRSAKQENASKQRASLPVNEEDAI